MNDEKIENLYSYVDINYSDDEIVHLNNSKTKLIVSIEGLKEYFEEVLNNYESAIDRVVIGRIKDEVANKIINDIGVNLKNYSLTYNKSYLMHINKRHIINEKDNIPIKKEDLFLFSKIISQYDRISIENKKIILEKWIFSCYRIVVECSIKSKSIVLNSIYKIKKERNKSLPTSHEF